MRIKIPLDFKQFRLAVCAGVCVAFATYAVPSAAQQVQLQEGTATLSQNCCGIDIYASPAQSIDGIFTDSLGVSVNGWAVLRVVDGVAVSRAETAVWETVSSIGPGTIKFTMFFLHANPGHLLGRFRFSVTTDDRSTFADGLPAGGNVTANWTVLTDPTVLGPAGMTFTTLSDNSVLAGGVVPGTGIYEVSYSSSLSGVTGIRLEALEDPSLGVGTGPGLFPYNGNFVLTELQVNVTPDVDTTPPVLTLPGNITTDATSPAGAIVNYMDKVTATDDSGKPPTVSCTPPSGNIFPISPPPTTVYCTATDAANNSATGSFTVTVNGAMEQLLKLLSSVGIYSNPWGITNSLATKLQNVIDALNAMNQGSTLRACNSLNAFISEAQAQLGKKLMPMPDAAQLIASANQIRAVLGCP